MKNEDKDAEVKKEAENKKAVAAKSEESQTALSENGKSVDIASKLRDCSTEVNLAALDKQEMSQGLSMQKDIDR